MAFYVINREARIRRQAEAVLQNLNDELEQRVHKRTTALALVNEDLKAEVAERKQAETHLHKLNRTYAFLSDINQTIVHVRDRQLMFELACQIAVEQGGFKMAWLGLLDPQTRQALPVAWAGVTNGYLEKLRIVLDDSEQGRGPTASALSAGRHVVVNDIETDPRMLPWRADALSLGYRASAAFPLMAGEKVCGTLNLYAAEKNVFDEEELRLLDEMAGDISFAIEFSEQDDRRRQSQDELRRSEQRLRTTLDTMLEGCQIIGFDWRYLYLNDTADTHNRRPKTELLGRTVMEAWPGIEHTAVFALEKQAMERRTEGRIETEFTFPDGATGWFDVSIQPVADGILIFSIDVTQRKLAEIELRALNTELEQRVAERTERLTQANKELESFSYSVSHDLRAPLRAISGFASIVARRHRANLNEEGQHYIDNVVQASERMGHLIDDLLTYSRVGRTGIRRDKVALAELIEKLAGDFRDHLAGL